MKKIIILTIVTTILTACSQELFNFTLVSTKSVELDRLSLLKKSSEKVTAEDKARLIIVIPTKTAKVDQAITNAIDAIPGCVALMDGVVHSKFWYIPYIYGEHKYVVEATPLIDPSYSQSNVSLPNYSRVIINKDGKVHFIEPISEAEYLAEKSKVISNSRSKPDRPTILTLYQEL